ncbi:unnamed protein product [Phytophthora lilii]|uniref:Unnamed protein product n=1 Tax=Phytophthora lilii TaxID=2077276 RepID=A0A9W6U417_9STRA|nr:unnamed protein product [Phytophthora lilii]
MVEAAVPSAMTPEQQDATEQQREDTTGPNDAATQLGDGQQLNDASDGQASRPQRISTRWGSRPSSTAEPPEQHQIYPLAQHRRWTLHPQSASQPSLRCWASASVVEGRRSCFGGWSMGSGYPIACAELKCIVLDACLDRRAHQFSKAGSSDNWVLCSYNAIKKDCPSARGILDSSQFDAVDTTEL